MVQEENKLKKLALALLILACTVVNAQSKPITRLRSFAAPVGTAYSSILVTWQFTPNAPPCPTSGVLTNCINGFNTTITLGGTTVYSATAGYGAGQLSPSALTYTWTPTAGVSFGTYTVTVTTAGFDANGNAIFSTPAQTTVVASLLTLNPPTNLTATGK